MSTPTSDIGESSLMPSDLDHDASDMEEERPSKTSKRMEELTAMCVGKNQPGGLGKAFDRPLPGSSWKESNGLARSLLKVFDGVSTDKNLDRREQATAERRVILAGFLATHNESFEKK